MKPMTMIALAFGVASSAAGCADDNPRPVEVPEHYSIEECRSYAEAAAALVEERNRGGDEKSMQNVLAGVGPEESRKDMLVLIDYVWSPAGALAWPGPHRAKDAVERQCVGRASSREIGARID